MKIFFIITILCFTTFAICQRGGRGGGMSGQRIDPKNVPKIGVVYGTVIDSTSSTPILTHQFQLLILEAVLS